MDYTNPNFNVIVSSPSRTGSVFIATVFYRISKIAPIYREFYQNEKEMGPKECLHSHDPKDVFLCNEHTLFIVSKRNMIESTFSNLIGQHTGKWRHYKDNTIDVKPFYMSIDNFMFKYNQCKIYYETLKPNLPFGSLVIDYNDFKDDNAKLFDILQISKQHLKFFPNKEQRYPIKTPGTYKDWIINYDEIWDVAKTLDPNPCI